MKPPPLPARFSEGATPYVVWVCITEGGFNAKFYGMDGERLFGIGLSRENPEYYAAIGRWFCSEVEAMALKDDPYTPEPEIKPL